ncbi:MAG: OmpH family outer membrane protein [Aquificae bacterium]|nr:OmpH family outer membrane protein [Aquificota bacterium]
MFKFLRLFLPLLFLVSLSYGKEAVVYIDMQKVAESSKAGLSIQSELKAMVENLKKEIEKKKKEGATDTQIQAFIQEKQKELNQRRNQLIQKFMTNLQKALGEYAKQKGYKLILTKEIILYGKPQLDKTQDFIKFFDKKYGTLK